MGESGRVRGIQNVTSFEEFVRRNNEANDWGQYVSPNGEKLDRKLISEECKFGKSALIQNKPLKQKFENLEDDLRQRGILVPKTSQQSPVFAYSNQAMFIKDFEEMLLKFKSDADNIKNLLAQYSKELKA